MNSLIIIDNYFTPKRVSFSNEVNEYDGSSDFNNKFVKLCTIHFNSHGVFNSSFDIINFIYNHDLQSSFVEKCLEELNISKKKLLELEKNEKFEYISSIITKSNALSQFISNTRRYTEEDQDEYFRYWNNEFWTVRSTMVNGGSKKIGLVRKGSRDCSMCLSVVHLPKLEALIQLLEDTMEWYK